MRNIILATAISLMTAGCNEQVSKSANKFEAKDGKICSSNSTDATLYFVLSESGNGKMRGKITPGSRFCTGSYTNAQLSVSIEKRGDDYCQIQAKQGILYTLTKLNTDGPCEWSQS